MDNFCIMSYCSGNGFLWMKKNYVFQMVVPAKFRSHVLGKWQMKSVDILMS